MGKECISTDHLYRCSALTCFYAVPIPKVTIVFALITEGWGMYSFCQNVCAAQKNAPEALESIYIFDKYSMLNRCKQVRLTV